MPVTAISCPRCTAPLPKGDEELVCPYCGSRLKFEEAREELSGDELTRQAVRAFKAEEYRKAIPDFEKALAMARSENKTEDILSLLGLSYDYIGQFEKSIAYHERATAANPRYYKGWVNMGIAYRRNGNLNKAEECYLRALQIAPDYAELHCSLGALYIFRDEPDKAIRALEHAIQLDSSISVSYANLALALAMAGRFPEAESSLKKAIVHGYKDAPVIRKRIEDLKG